MDLLIFAAVLLLSALAVVIGLRLDGDLRERQEWERFQQAMADTQNPNKET